MISIDVGVFYDAVNSASPHFRQARELVERLSRSTEVVIPEPTFVALYGALVSKSPEGAVRVIRQLRTNPRWRVVDIQSTRLDMNPVWEKVLSEGLGVADIRRLRMVSTLRRNGVDKFYTTEAEAYHALGFLAAVSAYA